MGRRARPAQGVQWRLRCKLLWGFLLRGYQSGLFVARGIWPACPRGQGHVPVACLRRLRLSANSQWGAQRGPRCGRYTRHSQLAVSDILCPAAQKYRRRSGPSKSLKPLHLLPKQNATGYTIARDRKSAVQGKSVSGVDLGGRRTIKNKTKTETKK